MNLRALCSSNPSVLRALHKKPEGSLILHRSRWRKYLTWLVQSVCFHGTTTFLHENKVLSGVFLLFLLFLLFIPGLLQRYSKAPKLTNLIYNSYKVLSISRLFQGQVIQGVVCYTCKRLLSLCVIQSFSACFAYLSFSPFTCVHNYMNVVLLTTNSLL